jgi:hypothetical protein
MASGTTGFGLDASQVKRAREAAAGRSPVLAAPRLLEKALDEARAGRPAAARLKLEALLSTPGESELKEKARQALGRLKRE